MVYMLNILKAVEELEEDCSASEIADFLELDLAEAALGLLRCYRAGLLERWKGQGLRSWQFVYHYALTLSGTDRLLWCRRHLPGRKC